MAMEAICKVRHPMELPEHQRNKVDQYSGEYPITIDRTYVVGGMMISEGRLLFLVRDDDGDPLFAPAAFFDTGEQDVPEGGVPPTFRTAEPVGSGLERRIVRGKEEGIVHAGVP